MGSPTGCQLLVLFTYLMHPWLPSSSGKSSENVSIPFLRPVISLLLCLTRGFHGGLFRLGVGGIIVNMGTTRGMRKTLPSACTSSASPGEVCKTILSSFSLPFSQGSDDLPAEYYWLLWPHITVTDLCGLQGSWMVQIWDPLEEKRDEASAMLPVTTTQCSLWNSHPCLRFWEWATEILK